MAKFEIRAGEHAFTCPLSALTEEAALDELTTAWQQSFRAGNNTYLVPGSIPSTSIDMAPGTVMAARWLSN